MVVAFIAGMERSAYGHPANPYKTIGTLGF